MNFTLGAWAGQLVDVLKKSSQRPAALASLPVVPKKRCIFHIHCPREPRSQISHTNRGDNTDRDRGRGIVNNGGNISLEDESDNLNGIPRPSSNTPLVIEPGGVYFRPEGSGGKYIAGVSPSIEQVRLLLTPYLPIFLYLTLYLCLPLTLCFSLSLYPSLCRSLSLCCSVSSTVFLYLSIYLPLSVFLSLSFSLSRSRPFSLFSPPTLPPNTHTLSLYIYIALLRTHSFSSISVS